MSTLTKYPKLTLHNAKGEQLAISEGWERVPAYSRMSVLSHAEMRATASKIRGFVMQKDDPYLSAFTLYNFAR